MNVSRTVELVDMVQSCSLEDLIFLHAYLQLKINKESVSQTSGQSQQQHVVNNTPTILSTQQVTTTQMETPTVVTPISLTTSSDYIPTVLQFDTPKTETVVKQQKWSEIVSMTPVSSPKVNTLETSATVSVKDVATSLDSRCALMVKGWDPSLFQWQDVRKWFTSTLEAPLGLMSVYVNKKGYALLKFTNTRDAEKAWKLMEMSDHFQRRLQIKWNK